MPYIDEYEFGKIVIEGKTYTSDVIIFPDSVMGSWWRKEGHNLCLEDLESVLANPPEVLIIGTGYGGAMHVPQEVLKDLVSRGIKVIVEPTRKAVNSYNELSQKQKTVAALHLTC